MTPPLDLTELRAALPSGRLIAERREDGTARIYSPSLGVMRKIVDFAETTTEFADLIVALPRLIAELEAARSVVECFRAATTSPSKDVVYLNYQETRACVVALSAYDAATKGGG